MHRSGRRSERRLEREERKKQERKKFFILSGAILLIALLTAEFFTYRNYPNEKSVDDAYLSDYQKFTMIDIPQTKSLLFDSQNKALNQIATGKVYYKGENGKLESHIDRKNKNEIYEELISYDNNGNAVDELEIGYISNSPKHLKCAVIDKNKISIYETIPSDNDDSNEKIVTEYLISPQMKFTRGKTYTKL